MCEEFARAQVSDEVVQALRMGRLTALQKSSGGIRGIVVGDFIRRLVARTLAQQLNPAIEQATSPFQFALTTKSGCECIAHIAQALTDLDGIGAFDLISGSAMLQGLLEVEGGGSVLPFVKQSYGSPSPYWWDDDEGVTHEIVQGEGGEQGDPLMLALYALGQHKALVAVSERLLPTERLLAFHDDLYVLCGPPRVADVHIALQLALWEHSRIQVHHGKTQLWNRGGEAPRGWLDPDAIVWRGDPELPPSEQGVKVLGTPLGILSMCGLFSRTRPEPTANCWSGSQQSPICRVHGWCCSSAQVLGQIICLERFLQSVRRTSRLNTTIPCEGASADFWVVTYLTLRGTSLDCLSRLGALVCAVHVE